MNRPERVVTESEYEKELWRRIELEQLCGEWTVKQWGLSHSQYIQETEVQMELDYGDWDGTTQRAN